MVKKIFIAADHAGFKLKNELMAAHPELPWVDLGTNGEESVDYPDFSNKLCEQLIQENAGYSPKEDALKAPAIGVLVCGSGQGVAIKANRYPEIRAALCWNKEITLVSRGHNNANVLSLGARFVSTPLAQEILMTFLQTAFEGGRHAQRVAKLS